MQALTLYRERRPNGRLGLCVLQQGTVRAKESLGIGDDGVDGEVETSRDGDTDLTGWEEDAGEDVSEEKGGDGGNDASEGNTDADGAEFGEVSRGVFVEGDEAFGAEQGSKGRRDETARDDADEFKEGGEVILIFNFITACECHSRIDNFD